MITSRTVEKQAFVEKGRCSAIQMMSSSILSNTGHQNNITKQLNQKQISVLHLIFHRLTVVLVLICSLKKELTPKIRMMCFVIINSVLSYFLCVWILF